MRSNSTFGIQFVIRGDKGRNDGRATVFARVSVNGRRCEISLKKKVSAHLWDNVKGRAKGTREETRRLNAHIERVRTIIADGYHQLIEQKKAVTVESVKSLFLGEEDERITLLWLTDYHNREMKGKLAHGTMKNYHTTQGYIRIFLKERYRRTDMALSELNYAFIVDFETFLRNYQPKDYHKPLNNNGIMKHIERLCKMVNMAVKMDWLAKDPFAKFRKHFDKVERQCLTQAELSAIAAKDFSIERLCTVRDMFLFSCYTGLAYIDLVNLAPDNIVKGMDGGLWIATHGEKTDTAVRVPLLPQARELIERYSGHPMAVNSGRVFPVISNQRMNGYLKEIADLCEITKTLMFHIARHTFATTVTLSNGVPIESVSKMLGHTSIRTTQIYAKVVESKLSEDMGRLREKLDAQAVGLG